MSMHLSPGPQSLLHQHLPDSSSSSSSMESAGRDKGQKNSLLMPPSLSFTSPTPEASPIAPTPDRTRQSDSNEGAASSSILRPPPRAASGSGGSKGKGKRKADEDDHPGAPPDAKKDKESRATFAVGPRRKLLSNRKTNKKI